ncbi:lactosylceramide 4-alpha-galactosyltransferase-like [Dermacentor variabilis]|uniref:lactosylceramide 4-alpha-galactosyltransferase-like n=1 Tax=Dermacentor variabilis TaxID=34621 RepID=UPI003F5B8E9E
MQDRSRRLSRPLLVLALLLSLLMCYLIVSEWGWRSGTSYSKQTTETWTDSVPPETAGFSRIFFLETGGSGSLTARISCAVESAARVHPRWTVYLLAAASGYASRRNVTFAGPFAQVLRSIPNVVVDVVRPNEVFEGTPLESWYESGILSKSAYPVEHLADALRLAVLYKQGGVYLDIDVIVMRSLDSLPPCVCQSPVVSC